VATTIVLVRHGETDWNRERRFQGRADTPLNDAGRAQARELAELLASEPLAALYTSPLRRALETATIVGARLGLEVGTSEAMQEIDVGSWQGLTVDEVRARFPEEAHVTWAGGWDGGETYAQLDERVVAGLLELGARHEGRHLAVITHGGPIRSAIAASHGLSFDDARPLFEPLANCAVVRVAVEGRRVHTTG
jgi:broad specificity phosphatase PhoE